MPDMILMNTEEQMEARINGLKREFTKVRTGRANPKMLDDIRVDYYGALTPLGQVGNISVPEANQIVFKPYDRTVLGAAEKAILAANLGINPNNEGQQLRIVLPALTTERRKELVKQVKKMGEETKVFVRNARRDGNDEIKKLEKNSDITEDESKQYHEEIQELTDNFVKLVDELVKEKEEDIMSI
ncbi:MAG: ribosome recycling factor [Firmicutes bacterium]|nr:ribosome recycling factor [Bacillota bacterium]